MLSTSAAATWITRSLTVAICIGSALGTSVTRAQEQLRPAVIALRVDVAAMLSNEFVQPLREEVEKGLPPGQAEMLEVTNNISSISAQIAAPEEFTPNALNYTDFLITLNFVSAEVAKKEYQALAGFQDGTVDGKEYKQTGGEFGIPLILARLNETSIDIGSKAYITSGKKNFASPALGAAYRQLPKAPIRMAADLEPAKVLVGQAVDVMQEAADPFTKELIRPLRHLKQLQLHVDLNSDAMLGLTAETFETDQAEGIKNKLSGLIGLAKNALQDAPNDAMKTLAVAVLDLTKLSQNDTRTSLQVMKPAKFEAYIKQLVEQAQKAARRMEDGNKFKQVGLAMHNFGDVRKQFPFKPSEQRGVHQNLSWRVAVLPFIEQQRLYQQFDTQAGWDSAQNKPLVEQTPAVFTLSNGSGMSWIRPENPPGFFQDIRDGTANTACLLENPDAGKQPWTKPQPLTVDQAIKLVKSQPDGEVLTCLSYDGAVHQISNKPNVETLKRFFTHNDGQPLERNAIHQ